MHDTHDRRWTDKSLRHRLISQVDDENAQEIYDTTHTEDPSLRRMLRTLYLHTTVDGGLCPAELPEASDA